MRPIQGSTVLVVGAGNIGATFAGMCHGLGAETIGLKRTVRGPVDGFDRLDTLANLDQWLPIDLRQVLWHVRLLMIMKMEL